MSKTKSKCVNMTDSWPGVENHCHWCQTKHKVTFWLTLVNTNRKVVIKKKNTQMYSPFITYYQLSSIKYIKSDLGSHLRNELIPLVFPLKQLHTRQEMKIYIKKCAATNNSITHQPMRVGFQ
jgi:hypothetical protein